MMSPTNKFARKALLLPGRQRGAVTMFTAVLILILLTEVILYSTQVGVFEQRKSANDVRQKQAFHAAEAGLQLAKEFFLANGNSLALPASGGWLESGASRWELCPSVGTIADQPEHPCNGEAFPRAHDSFDDIYSGTYFYNFGDGGISLPIDADNVVGLDDLDATVDVYALLCVLDINRGAPEGSPVVQGCTTTPAPGEHIYFMLTLLARGNAACTDPDDLTTCEAEALIAQKVGSYGPAVGDGGPNVPLTTRSNFPPSGTSEIVPNPNAGGPGVPVSAWINSGLNPACPQDLDGEPLDGDNASWATCEAHEWYGVDTMPDDYACPTAQCSCGPGQRLLSSPDDGAGIDILVDPLFPCDLFTTTFGVEKTVSNFNTLISGIGQEIDDCGILDEYSSGVYWMTGDTCSIQANTQIGSMPGGTGGPVFLVSAAQETKLAGGAEIWGVLWVSDVLHPDASFESKGTNTIYGAAVVDAELGSYTGTFQIVYVDSVVRIASSTGGIGKISGGWTDFHPTWR